jgi:hypothetical protein
MTSKFARPCTAIEADATGIGAGGAHGGGGPEPVPPHENSGAVTVPATTLDFDASANPSFAGVTACGRSCAAPTLLRGSVAAAYDAPPRATKSARVDSTFAYVSLARNRCLISAPAWSAVVEPAHCPLRSIVLRDVAREAAFERDLPSLVAFRYVVSVTVAEFVCVPSSPFPMSLQSLKLLLAQAQEHRRGQSLNASFDHRRGYTARPRRFRPSPRQDSTLSPWDRSGTANRLEPGTYRL